MNDKAMDWMLMLAGGKLAPFFTHYFFLPTNKYIIELYP